MPEAAFARSISRSGLPSAASIAARVGGRDDVDGPAIGVVLRRADDHAAVIAARRKQGSKSVGSLRHEHIRGDVGLVGIEREQVRLVPHAVAVGVGIAVVACTVAVRVGPFVRIVGKQVAVVPDAIAVGIHCLASIVRERVRIVADAVAVRVGPLVWIVRKRIAVVADAIAVGIRGFRPVEGERVRRVRDAIAVVVLVGVVAHAVAVGVVPLAGILRQVVDGVHEAVAVFECRPYERV